MENTRKNLEVGRSALRLSVAVSLEWQRELNKAVLEERQRLRREIHDGIAQTVSYPVMRLSFLLLLVEKHNLAGLERGLGDSRKP